MNFRLKPLDRFPCRSSPSRRSKPQLPQKPVWWWREKSCVLHDRGYFLQLLSRCPSARRDKHVGRQLVALPQSLAFDRKHVPQVDQWDPYVFAIALSARAQTRPTEFYPNQPSQPTPDQFDDRDARVELLRCSGCGRRPNRLCETTRLPGWWLLQHGTA